MRPVRIITAVALTAAVAAAGSYIAYSTTRSPAAAPAEPAVTAPTDPPAGPATTAPATGNGDTTGEPVVLADGRHAVLLKTVDPGRGKITFDVIQFYQGDDATREAAKDHQESPPPNDHYTRNVNPKLRTLPVSADAPITVNGLINTQESTPVTLAKLATLTSSYSPVFWVTVRDDQVVKIGEQWMP